MKPEALARQMAPPRKRGSSLVPRHEVVDVDVDAKTATVKRADGSTFDVYTVDGTLPALGDFVPIFQNGGDPFTMSGRIFASGSWQSPSFSLGDETGFGLFDDGRLVAFEGQFSGDVTGARFRTAVDGPRVEITGDADARRVRLFTGDDDEVAPGAVESFDDATMAVVQMISPTFDIAGADSSAMLRLGIDRGLGRTFGECVADDWRVNDVSISSPPFSMKRRVAGLTIASSTTAFQVVLFDTDHLVHWQSHIAYDPSNGTWSIKRPGIYTAGAIFGWSDQAVDTGSREIRCVDDGAERVLETKGAALSRRTFHNVADKLIVTDADDANPYTYQFKAGQHNAGPSSLDLTGRAWIEWSSGIDAPT